jgi:hypothetical protein
MWRLELRRLVPFVIGLVLFISHDSLSAQEMHWAEVDSPDDIAFTIGEIGQSIIWHPSSDVQLY